MGRTGEVSTRCWQTAHKNKEQFGKLPEDAEGNDNFRVLRYLSKLCINPAIAAGISDYVGSLNKGTLGDVVIWDPMFFGAKPKMVFKGGFIAYSMMGDPNASIPTPEPYYWRPMFGGFGKAQSRTAAVFVSKAANELNIKERYDIDHQVLPVSKTRNLGKAHMVRNDRIGEMTIDPETHKVTFDGKDITSKPAKELPMTQLYYLF
jgi:urease subunit alpha